MCVYNGLVSVLDVLKPHSAFNAEYNSQERQDSQHTSICEPGTREHVINEMLAWAGNEDDHTPPICWLYGPAGTGKSSVVHTIAEICTAKGWLVLTFFFSRGRVDRNAMTKLFTTLAYQLAVSKALSAGQKSIGQAIQDDPRVLTANFETQFHKFIADPIMADTQSAPQIIIIIDGVDECDSFAHQTLLVKLLVKMAPRLSPHARFLVTSRPEEQITSAFHVPAAQNITKCMSLHDFNAENDIRHVCHARFAEIAGRDDWKKVTPKTWPSDAEIEQVVQRSQRIFIYISTLLRFVEEGDKLPQEKLQDALQAHARLDGIYHQVLKLAQGKHLQLVMSSIILLVEPLTIVELGKFLDLTPATIRVALRGTASILNIPADDNQAVLPYHASLGDFVKDRTRSKPHFSSLSEQHEVILKHCIQHVTTAMENPEAHGIYPKAIMYACWHWSNHLAALLTSSDELTNITAYDIQLLKGFVLRIGQKWLRQWLYSLYDVFDGRSLVATNLANLEKAYEKLKVYTSTYYHIILI